MNHRFTRPRVGLIALTAAGLVLTGCATGSAPDDTPVAVADSVTVGTSITIDNLNPFMTQYHIAVGTAYDTLVRPERGGTGQFEPRLAESWENVSDTEWVFTLREGVTFHDGSELTAEDVVFTFDQTIEAKTISSVIVEGFASYEATDDYTVRIVTSKPDPLLFTNLSQIFIVPSDAWQELGADAFASQPIGTGPYQISDFSPDSGMTLTRFDDFWGEAPVTETIHIRLFADPTTLTSSIEAGEIDVAHNLPATASATLQGNGSLELIPTSGGGTSYLQMNTFIAPFDNPEVRRAANLAIDREGLIAAATLGMADPEPGQLTNPEIFGYTDTLTAPEFDLEEAKRIIEKEGAVGAPVKLTGIGVMKPTLEAVAGMLKEAGLDATVNIVEIADWLTLFRITDAAQWASSDTAVFARGLSYVGTYDANRAFQYISRLVDDADWNELQQAQLVELDPEAREQLLIEAAEYIYDQDLVLWTTQGRGVGATLVGVTGADFGGGIAMDFTKLAKAAE